MSDLLHAIANSSMVRNIQVLSVTTPAPGAEYIITPRAGEIWKILAVRSFFTASVAVANRLPTLVVDDGTTDGWQIPIPAVMAASSSQQIGWVADFNAALTVAPNLVTVVPIPSVILPTGWRLRSETVLIQAADQYSMLSVYFERLDEPPYRNPLLGTALDEMIEHEIQQRLAGG